MPFPFCFSLGRHSQAGGVVTPPPPPPPPPPSGTLSMSVLNGQLVDGNNQPLFLRGANLEGLCDTPIQGWSPNNPWGDSGLPGAPNMSILKNRWNMNAVRLPLSSATWLHLTVRDHYNARGNGAGAIVNPDPGNNANTAAIALVNAATAAGMYVIIDLHWDCPGDYLPYGQNPMASSDNGIAFWKSIAAQFGNYPNVAFELFNEPFDWWYTASDHWAQWRDGGTVSQLTSFGSPYNIALNWQMAGMNQMITAIRSTGASNVVIAGGNDYANDLSGWLSHAPTDPYNQLCCAWHAYPVGYNAQGVMVSSPHSDPKYRHWATEIRDAGYPVIITETGDENSPGTNGSPYLSEFLPWCDTNNMGVLFWAIMIAQSPANIMIKNTNYDPTDGYGEVALAWLNTH